MVDAYYVIVTVVSGNPHHVSPMPCDPRNPMDKFSLWRRLEAMELPVPRFKVSECSSKVQICAIAFEGFSAQYIYELIMCVLWNNIT